MTHVYGHTSDDVMCTSIRQSLFQVAKQRI